MTKRRRRRRTLPAAGTAKARGNKNMRVSEIESDSEKVRQRHPQVPDLDGPDKLELEGPREPLKDLEQWSDKVPKDHS